MKWSVSSVNLRFSGGFHVPGCNAGGEDSCLIGGVGRRGSRSIGVDLAGTGVGYGGGNTFAYESSFVYEIIKKVVK